MRLRNAFCALAFLPCLGAGALDARVTGGESLLLQGKLAWTAFAYLGTPYRYAGSDASGMDCSGLVMTVYREAAGMDLERTVEGLFTRAKQSASPLHVGDLLFFDTSEKGTPSRTTPSHVGLFVGGGRFVHSASEGARTGVIVSSLAEKYYADRYIGARRVLQWQPPALELALGGGSRTVSLETPIPACTTLEVKVTAGDGAAESVHVSLVKEGREVQSRRLALHGSNPAVFPLVASEGRWTLSVSAASSGELQTVSFEAKE